MDAKVETPLTVAEIRREFDLAVEQWCSSADPVTAANRRRWARVGAAVFCRAMKAPEPLRRAMDRSAGLFRPGL